MGIISILIILSLFLVSLAVIGYIWAVGSGQFDDCDTPPLRMLTDDEPGPARKDLSEEKHE
ncbi:MAG TPA: cbb3-type cytochrome oxidase assembly protein CcoS [Oligoflexia bacterium]|nr:cbb3-type cytochrome oxidase assembly protein CcoS [Oligoflexia bacterium]